MPHSSYSLDIAMRVILIPTGSHDIDTDWMSNALTDGESLSE